jgi:GTP-binding protein
MFVDRVRIVARAGKGGRGMVSFLRELHRPNGGPNGGDGGCGGDVILKVDQHVNNLFHLNLSPHQFAKNGAPGGSKDCSGKNAEHFIIKVPQGTIVHRLSEPGDDRTTLLPMPFSNEGLELVCDLTERGQEFVLCKGGRGGKGNRHFKSSTHQAPREYEEGLAGECGQYLLELKSIADVGLVGFPNAGKSSLLKSISNADPKIASYPFTTMAPYVAMIEYPDYKQVSIADIPGLIEGAHEGKGLGFEFLQHIERCRLLLFVVDMAGSEGRDPLDDYAQLRTELKLFREDLAKRPFLIIANKMDLPAAAENLKIFKRKVRKKIIPLSAQDGDGIEELKVTLRETIDEEAS